MFSNCSCRHVSSLGRKQKGPLHLYFASLAFLVVLIACAIIVAFFVGDLMLFASIEPNKIDLLQTAIQILNSLLPDSVEALSPAAYELTRLRKSESVRSEDDDDDDDEVDTTLACTRRVAIESHKALHGSGVQRSSHNSMCTRSAALQALREYDCCDQDSDLVEREKTNRTECNDSIFVSSGFTSEIRR
jgi:hypothetical protein